mmetsp:Transcript_99564/g.320998  ORF Transcript_99564/g.320998 Transcript_99564/m.320998 type:complete len:251 (+) Transcript_99564:1132-1884(+)
MPVREQVQVGHHFALVTCVCTQVHVAARAVQRDIEPVGLLRVQSITVVLEILEHQHLRAPLALHTGERSWGVQRGIGELVHVKALAQAPIRIGRAQQPRVVHGTFLQLPMGQGLVRAQALDAEQLRVDVCDVRVPLGHQLPQLLRGLIAGRSGKKDLVAQAVDPEQEGLGGRDARAGLERQQAVHHDLQHRCRAALEALAERRLDVEAKDVLQEVLRELQVVPPVALLPCAEAAEKLRGKVPKTAGAEQR